MGDFWNKQEDGSCPLRAGASCSIQESWNICFNLNRFCCSYAWYCSLCEGRTFFCPRLTSKKFCGFLCFWLALFHSVSYFFFLHQTPSTFLYLVLDTISSNTDEVVLINPSANMFVFGDFNIHHKGWITYFGGTDRPGELCCNSCISNDHTRMVNFPTQIPDCDSYSPALSVLFLLMLVFFLQ